MEILRDDLHELDERYVSIPVALNSQYGAYISDGEIYIGDLKKHDGKARRLENANTAVKNGSSIALSPVRPQLLATTHGSQILVFDVASGSVQHNLSGTGRTVTSISWSQSEPCLLFAGLIDGSINIWSIDQSSKPICQIPSCGEQCIAIEVCPGDKALFASNHGFDILVWSLQHSSTRPTLRLRGDRALFQSIAWCTHPSKALLAIAAGAELRVYDVSEVVNPDGSKTSDSDSEDATMIGELDGDYSNPRIVATIELEVLLKDITWAGDRTLLGLTENGRQVVSCAMVDDDTKLAHLWSCDLSNTTYIVRLQRYGEHMKLVALGDAGVEFLDVPAAVKDNLNTIEHAEPSGLGSIESRARKLSRPSEGQPDLTALQATKSMTKMRPVSIRSQQAARSAFSKTSKQLQRKRTSSSPRSQNHPLKAKSSSEEKKKSPSTLTPPHSGKATSDRELTPDAERDGSPMPFLSPSIPSRRPSPNGLPQLDDSVPNLTPLPRASFDTYIPSTATTPGTGHESDDSDDETFADALQGSGVFLPGGVNVPLPKACGALFAPNGQLLTFFPPRPRPATARRETLTEEPRESTTKDNKIAKLFSTFGNLSGDSKLSDESDSDALSSHDSEIEVDGLRPILTFQPASFPSQQSWKSRGPLAELEVNEQPSQHKIVISVHEVQDVESLYPAQRQLAQEYCLLCQDHQSGSDLCEQNAFAAEKNGCDDAAELWRLVALLLEDAVPLDALPRGATNDDILVVAQRARILCRNDSGIGLAKIEKHKGIFGRLRWANHPFSGAWLVRRVFEWAEQRADVQLLACISAILAEAEEKSRVKAGGAKRSMLAKLATYSPHYFTDTTAKLPRSLTPRNVPILQTGNDNRSALFRDSPDKLRHGSVSFSRNQSQPPTPYLDSSSSTPPFNLSSLSRNSARFSTSGSASPEYHRSSFSAAAKYYAQSITDKFSPYSTSPPIKKTGTSPSASNELSTSLPGGSWLGKSVSFASTTTETDTRDSRLSLKYEVGTEDDAYDSDKTIEDSSAPQTPKSPAGGIALTLKNQEMFSDEISGCAEAKLLPFDLAEKAAVWCQYYAEQLRSWNLLAEAAELDKIVGISGWSGTTGATVNSQNGMQPRTSRKTQRMCAICNSTATRVEQTCPSCLHTSHTDCLEDYCTELGVEEFTCSTGCGCICSELAYAVLRSPQVKPTFKKKASFTDPRRWRARVEGDSW